MSQGSALRDFRSDGAVDPRARLRLHASKGLAHLQVADHVDVAGLLQADPERLLQRLTIQTQIAGLKFQAHEIGATLGRRRVLIEIGDVGAVVVQEAGNCADDAGGIRAVDQQAGGGVGHDSESPSNWRRQAAGV